MEQQKILWITLSIAVLLLAVLGSALFIFGPSFSSDEQAIAATDTTTDTNKFDPIEWARTGSEYPTLNDVKTDNPEEGFVVAGEASDSNKDEVTISDDSKESGKTVVALPVKKIEQPKAPIEAPVVKKADPPVKTTPPKSVKNVKEYWIQTNSFTTIARAEEEKRVITAKGFPAVIQAKVTGDKTFYRVRIGSYATKAEAEKFLYWIKDIKGFEESQIYEVTVKREL